MSSTSYHITVSSFLILSFTHFSSWFWQGVSEATAKCQRVPWHQKAEEASALYPYFYLALCRDSFFKQTTLLLLGCRLLREESCLHVSQLSHLSGQEYGLPLTVHLGVRPSQWETESGRRGNGRGHWSSAPHDTENLLQKSFYKRFDFVLREGTTFTICLHIALSSSVWLVSLVRFSFFFFFL